MTGSVGVEPIGSVRCTQRMVDTVDLSRRHTAVSSQQQTLSPTPEERSKMPEIERTDADWRAALTPEQYEVLRRAGTERAFSGKYVNEHADGTYHCAACGAELFDSTTKFESGSGWPSFYQTKAAGAVELITDSSHGMTRTEVRCRRCGSHLGHLFPDGPAPTGQRYCMNSLALDLVTDTPDP